jgi:hypothetical protein
MNSKISLMLSFGISTVMLMASVTAPAQTFVYDANLSGPAESPPNASPGTGFAEVTVNLTTNMLTVHVNFSGLTGTTTASHIHAPTPTPGTGTAGVATQTPSFSGFPLGVTSGTYDHTFDMTMDSTWNSSYETANGGTASGAETAFVQALADGKAYLNIHTSTFSGGEIRGFLSPVPEPTTVTLMATSAIGFFWLAKKRRER